MKIVRKRERQFPVMPSQGRKVIRWTSRAAAEIYERLGQWCCEYDTQTGELLGFRLVAAEADRGDRDLMSIPSVPEIDIVAMEQNVCRSRTRGLRELDRLLLIKDGKAPEDEVERVQAKIRVYPRVGAAKGDILRAWPR